MVTVLFESSDRPREFRVPAPYLVVVSDATEPPKVGHLKALLRAAGVKRRNAPAKPTRPFEEILLDFRVKYPGGFAGDLWRNVREERARMESIVKECLAPDTWRGLLSKNSIGDLGKAHRQAVQQSGIMHPVQAARFATIADGGFWTFYGDWVWKPDAGSETFEEVVKGLATVGQATWPNVTALRGLLFPKSDLFVKPDSLKRTAAALRHELAYESRPTHGGYVAILDFAKRLLERLDREGLRPTDLWDGVQFCKYAAGGSVDVAKPVAPPKPRTKKSPKDEAANV